MFIYMHKLLYTQKPVLVWTRIVKQMLILEYWIHSLGRYLVCLFRLPSSQKWMWLKICSYITQFWMEASSAHNITLLLLLLSLNVTWIKLTQLQMNIYLRDFCTKKCLSLIKHIINRQTEHCNLLCLLSF